MAIISKLVYKGLKANLPTTRNADSFYLCTDTRELYFGTELYTEAVRFYNGAANKPAAPAQGVLYIDETTGKGEAWTFLHRIPKRRNSGRRSRLFSASDA